MLCSEINIRDPFILKDKEKYYLYGTRAAGFGVNTKGFDVYISDNLIDFSGPYECCNSEKCGLNRGVNWAPEVHRYNNEYYMFASFTKEEGLRGTYILKSDKPEGPFLLHSDGAVTPEGWECIDGTFYLEDGKPYLVFVHEHTQVIDGKICYIELSEDLKKPVSEPVTLFSASEPAWADKKPDGEHYVTDGPFMYRTKENTLLMIWSTFIKGLYAECIVRFENGSIKDKFSHLSPLIDNDGGHGMIFEGEDSLYFTYHSPNKSGYERVCLKKIRDIGTSVEIV